MDGTENTPGGRWLALAGVVIGAVAVVAGFRADWFVVTQHYTTAHWNPRAPMEVTDWCIMVIVVLAVSVAFAMLVGARRNLVPRLVSLVLAIAGAIGLVFFAWAMSGEQEPVELFLDYGFDQPLDHFPKVPVHFNAWPFIAAAGMAIVLVSAFRLWWIGRSLARASLANLARVDRELAARHGEGSAEQPIPRL